MSDQTNDVNLDITKCYTTRDGRRVSGLEYKMVEKSRRLLLGHVHAFGPCSWTLAGMYYTDNKVGHDLDLVLAT